MHDTEADGEFREIPTAVESPRARARGTSPPVLDAVGAAMRRAYWAGVRAGTGFRPEQVERPAVRSILNEYFVTWRRGQDDGQPGSG